MKSFSAITSIALAGLAQAGEIFTAPYGEGGTWNLYQFIDSRTTWDDAKTLAEAEHPPVGDTNLKGHLVTLSSAAENFMVRWILNKQSAWCGLTDNERFGGHEAGSDPLNGWVWSTGEPITYTNWKPNEPDNWTDSGTGEDAVFLDRYGKWSDAGSGAGGEFATQEGYVIEWESRAKSPPAGAIPIKKTWPAQIAMPPLVPGKWSARWVSGYTKTGNHSYSMPRNLWEAGALLMEAPSKSTTSRELAIVQKQGTCIGETPWLWLSTQDSNRQGWLPSSGNEGTYFPGLPPRNNYIGAMTGKIHVEKAGTYTFAITAEDAFALRIGSIPWKSAGGDGYIDPLDPLTITQPNGSYSSKALAVMDLPAGDHLVEALWMVETIGSEFHILSAPGTHLVEGATADWRPLGHQMSNEKVPALGISEAGWTLDCSEALLSKTAIFGLQDGLLKLELDLDRISKTGLASVNFSDAPSTNPAHFPGPINFPNDRPGIPDDNWPCRVRGRLIVPRDGLYHIGLHATGLASMRIKGGILSGISQTAQGPKGLNQRQDYFDFDGQSDINNEPKIVTEWQLLKGEYDIEVLMVKHTGPASLAIFSCPVGPYSPGLLTSGGAGIRPDLPGLPHASH